jgi:hypothetical protein
MKEALRSESAGRDGDSSTWNTDVSRTAALPHTQAGAGEQSADAGNGYLPPPQSLRPPGKDEPQPLQPQSQPGGFAPVTEPADAGAQAGDASASGYTIEEIRDAGRGVFGTLSAELGAVINYAFQQYGLPNAYVIGSEGGGAFLAGLRYGKGELHAKLNGQEIEPLKVYWQGPSLGWDFGASGSKALFLVYNLDGIDDVYHRFTGVDGSAYVVGGVGLTVLASRNMVVVPIRTGLGLRIGANIGYVKFSERATWNPF